MSVEHVSSLREFNDALNNSGNRLVVVDFHATWCGPCLAIAPFYESLASKYNRRARFLKVDVDVAQDVSAQCGVTAMPTFHMYRNGSLVSQFSGADQMRLAADIERYAPSSAEVSFSGAGQRLGADPNAPPKVNWDTPEHTADTAKSRREAALAAAAKRAEASKTEADAKNTAANAEAAAVSSASGSGEAGPSVPKEIESEATSVDPSGGAPAGNDSRLKVDAFLLKQMEEMGFPKIRSEKALILTGNKGLEQAMEWCFTHADDPDVDEPLTVVTEDGTVKSQLTPEECKRRADEALKKARARRAELDKQEEKEREKERLRSGKEINKARQLHEDQERKRAIEKRRQEKLEALAEKRRVRELLEADKQRRRERFNMGGSGQAGPSTEPSAPAPAEPKAPRAPSSASGAGKIQLRLPDGSRLEKEFQPEQSLEEVLSFIERERPELPVNSLRLSQQYPRRVFSRSDYQTTLQELELLPRGALNVSYH